MSNKLTNEEPGLRGHHPNRTPEEEEWLRKQLRQADREDSFMFAWQRAQSMNLDQDADTNHRPTFLNRLKRCFTRS